MSEQFVETFCMSVIDFILLLHSFSLLMISVYKGKRIPVIL